VVGTFGILYGAAEEGGAANGGVEMWSVLASHFTMLGAYSFLVFNLLCAPCVAAMATIKREMNNMKWFWAAIGYQCGLAYIAALCIYQFGRLFALHTGTALTALVLLVIVAAVIRKIVRDKRKGKCAGCSRGGGATACGLPSSPKQVQ